MSRQVQYPYQPGLFVLMGYSQAPLPDTIRALAQMNGCRSWNLSFGNAGHFFLVTTHPEVAENEETLVINLGLARDRETGAVLSAGELLTRRIAKPGEIAHGKLSGNTTLIAASKREPSASLFRHLIGSSTVMYQQTADSLFCSDHARLLLPLMPRVELDPDASLTHLLFRAVNGPNTYLKGMKRLEHGHLMQWKDGRLQDRLVQDLRPLAQSTIHQVTDKTVSVFQEQAEQMMAHYTRWLLKGDHGFANQLSGGIDSAALQYLLNQSLPEGVRPRSLSYSVSTPAFEHETEYARSASQALDTEHLFIPLAPEDYPDLLQHTIELVGQPIGHESMPCQMAVARHLAQKQAGIPFVLTGVAADTLLGTEAARRLLQLESYRKLPLAAPLTRAMAILLGPVWPNKAYGSRELAVLLRAVQDIHSPQHPLNTQGLFTDLATVEKAFGLRAIQQARSTKRSYEADYLDAGTMVEKVHVLQLTALVADEQPLINRMYNAYELRMLFPYLDHEFLGATFAIDPKVRFFANGRTKPILKRILEAGSSYDNVDKVKGHSGFDNDLWRWMREGVLREMVQAIERPAYLDRADFERKLEVPDWFTWNLLTMDLFQKQILDASS